MRAHFAAIIVVRFCLIYFWKECLKVTLNSYWPVFKLIQVFQGCLLVSDDNANHPFLHKDFRGLSAGAWGSSIDLMAALHVSLSESACFQSHHRFPASPERVMHNWGEVGIFLGSEAWLPQKWISNLFSVRLPRNVILSIMLFKVLFLGRLHCHFLYSLTYCSAEQFAR